MKTNFLRFLALNNKFAPIVLSFSVFSVGILNAQALYTLKSAIEQDPHKNLKILPVSLDGVSNKGFIVTGQVNDEGYLALYTSKKGGSFSKVDKPLNGEKELPEISGSQLINITIGGKTKGFLVLQGSALSKFYKINTDKQLLEDITSQIPAGILNKVGLFAVADIDNDGDDDVFYSSFGNRLLMINDGKGNFSQINVRKSIPYYATGGVEFGDIDGDGYPDLLMNGTDSETKQLQTALFKNNNKSSSTPNSFIKVNAGLTGTLYSKAIFVNKGKTSDIFVTGQPGALTTESLARLWVNNDNGTTFTKSENAFKGLRTAVTLLATDMNGDGVDDIIYCGGVSNNYEDPGNIIGGLRTLVYLSDGKLYKEAKPSDYFENISNAGTSNYIVDNIDVDGDGKNNDFIVAISNSNITRPSIFLYERK